MLNRREFGLLSMGAMLPMRVLADGLSAERKFIFLFNDGGWDTSHVFTPMWGIPGAHIEDGATGRTANGIDFVDHPDRPSVREFFERYGNQCAVLNGIEVPSITHERCRELILTGSGSLADDWGAVLAGQSERNLLLPHVVLDGPAYTRNFTDQVVRIGDSGQLPKLLDRSAFLESDLPISGLGSEAERLADAFVAQRANAMEAQFGRDYSSALNRIDELKAWDELNLDSFVPGCERDIAADCALAFDLFQSNLSRCAMLRYKGWCSEGWDTHQGLDLQSRNFGDLFAYINEVMDDLSTRTSASGNPLADEVTIVVFSEMGREPTLNSWGGRDHWTFTSALLIGAGIRGGTMVGSLDETGRGRRLDLDTGAPSDTGRLMGPDDFGATLLSLGGVDPAAILGDDPQPIRAVLT